MLELFISADIVERWAVAFNGIAFAGSILFAVLYFRYPKSLWRKYKGGAIQLALMSSVGVLAFVGMLRRLNIEKLADYLSFPAWLVVSVMVVWQLRRMINGNYPDPKSQLDHQGDENDSSASRDRRK